MAPKKKGGKSAVAKNPPKAGPSAGADDDWENVLKEFTPASATTDTKEEKVESAPAAAAPAEDEEDEEVGAEAGPTGGDDDKKKKDKKKKKKKPAEKAEKEDKKPLTAAARLLLERQAALRAEEERLRKLQEEEDRKAREEEEQRLEEERKKKEVTDKKKLAKKLKKEQQKKEGTYMTKAQKEKAARAKAAVESMQAAGLSVGPRSGEGEPIQKKKIVYDNKKKKGMKKKADEEEDAATPKADAEEESAPPTTPEDLSSPAAADEDDTAEVSKEAEKEGEEEEDDADWDEADWETQDLVVEVKTDFDDEEDLLLVEKKAEEERLRKLYEERKKREQEEAERRAQLGLDSDDSDNDDDGGIMKATKAGRRKALTKEAAEKKKAASDRRKKREEAARAARSEDKLRSPICCIMGHVDTGKTKLLDNIRRTNVQDAEAGGITQQIGATFFPVEAIKQKTERVNTDPFFQLEYKLPGLLIIDTPGHESFTNLRSRGSSLCDIAILVVDIMHGLEQQTLESLNLLRRRKTPFIVALNKIDRCYGWKPEPNRPFREALEAQNEDVKREFRDRTTQIMTAFAEQGLNARLYWENEDLRRQASIIPTSAITGEGVPDLQMMLVKLTQEMMSQSLMFMDTVQCTILEVKVLEGLGTTIDAILVNGSLREGDQIVVCTLDGPVVTTIRSLLTPQPMREMRVKGDYIHHPVLEAAMGVKICAQGIERAVAGTSVMVLGPDDDIEDIREEVMADLNTILDKVGQTKRGVYVQSSTLGALEALLEFLRSCDPPIPVSGVNIGPIHKKDVIRASVQLEHGKKEHATILAFDVKVTTEARELADEMGIKIFTADIIYHLFDQFTAYLNDLYASRRQANAEMAVFPCVLKILPQFVFNKKGPIIVGVDVVDGILRIGTPLCVPQLGMLSVGRVSSIENNHKEVQTAKKGSSVAIKIDTPDDNPNIMYGRHFDHNHQLYSKISRESIDVLKEHFKNDLTKEEWMLIVRMKPVFNII